MQTRRRMQISNNEPNGAKAAMVTTAKKLCVTAARLPWNHGASSDCWCVVAVRDQLATFIAEKTAEAVVPPWAVTARRGFHESARSGYSQIGTAYYKDVLAQQRAPQERRHTSSSHSKAARPQTGMSRLLGV